LYRRRDGHATHVRSRRRRRRVCGLSAITDNTSIVRPADRTGRPYLRAAHVAEAWRQYCINLQLILVAAMPTATSGRNHRHRRAVIYLCK